MNPFATALLKTHKREKTMQFSNNVVLYSWQLTLDYSKEILGIEVSKFIKGWLLWTTSDNSHETWFSNKSNHWEHIVSGIKFAGQKRQDVFPLLGPWMAENTLIQGMLLIG